MGADDQRVINPVLHRGQNDLVIHTVDPGLTRSLISSVQNCLTVARTSIGSAHHCPSTSCARAHCGGCSVGCGPGVRHNSPKCSSVQRPASVPSGRTSALSSSPDRPVNRPRSQRRQHCRLKNFLWISSLSSLLLRLPFVNRSMGQLLIHRRSETLSCYLCYIGVSGCTGESKNCATIDINRERLAPDLWAATCIFPQH